jgi:hypothetical protein
VNLEQKTACIDFQKPTKLGFDKSNGFTSFIEVAIYRCKVDCLFNLGDPDYRNEMQNWISANYNYIQMLESVQNTDNYSKPFAKGAGDLFSL